MNLEIEESLEYINIEKVRNAMRSFGNKKASSPDGFEP